MTRLTGFAGHSFLFCFLVGAAASGAPPGQDVLNLTFKGHYRDKPKTSIVRKVKGGGILTPVHYTDLADLVATLPADSAMRQKYPELDQKQSGFPEKRETEELRNVEVDCWIVAVKFEDGRGKKKGDDDFHVILANNPDPAHATFMSSEISGLPGSGTNRAPLMEARKSFLQIVSGDSFPGGFVRVTPPRKVEIRGSLFFDGDHDAGCEACPGPSWAKPPTVWEIHPIYSITEIQ